MWFSTALVLCSASPEHTVAGQHQTGTVTLVLGAAQTGEDVPAHGMS